MFLRGEYHDPYRELAKAIADAQAKGYLGKNVFGTGFDLDLRIHSSGGRYICGEETALLNALEGKRAQPRMKPPFPPASGAWGRPTIVNNVETFCNVPGIIRNGVEWYHDLGLTEDAGTKIYGVSGRVNNPALWELPIGTTIREIIDEHAGGMRNGVSLRGILPGGASTDFLVEEHFDLAMDYGTIQAAGSRMGTGTMILMDDSICPVDMSRNLQHFFAQESCGFCTPCREGLPWVEELLTDIEEGRGKEGDLDLLDRNAAFIGAPGNTFCLHATGAIEPLQSALKYFREDFEEHIRLGRCPINGGSGLMAVIEVDGQMYEVADGANLLAAVLSEQLDLPYFCWHPAMGSVGACRQCAIIQYADENDERGRLTMACMTSVSDGMRISIAAPHAADFRETVIEWLMENHPHDCPVCEEGGECHLQDMTVMTGHSVRRYEGQ